MRRESRVRRACVQACAVVIGLTLGTGAARAATIGYTVEQEAGSTWVYSYTVANTSLPAGIEEFRVHFARGLFADLETAASPGDWDPLVVQPDELLLDDGFFDALALAAPLALGAALDGFRVRFTYLGAGTPGAQPFAILDPRTLDVLFEGRTSRIRPPPVGVPEPATGALLAASLGLLLLRHRRRQAAHSSDR